LPTQTRELFLKEIGMDWNENDFFVVGLDKCPPWAFLFCWADLGMWNWMDLIK